MIKIYRSFRGKLSVSVGTRRIVFDGYDGRYIYCTDNIAVQRAMETDDRYGKMWELEDVTLKGVYEEEPEEAVPTTQEFFAQYAPKSDKVSTGTKTFATKKKK